MMNIMYFVYTDWDKQKEREGKCVLSNIRTAYVAIISSNLHEYLTSILHNLIQQLLWNTWILFLRFQSIYRILCFTMHAQKTMRTICQMSNYWNWSILSHWSEYQIMIPMQLYSSFSFTIQQVDQHFKWNILIMCW